VNDTRWKGTWWTPGVQDDAKPGTLHYNDDGQLKLELVGGFSLMVPVQAAAGVWVSQEREPLFPVIHGMCGSERFTLLMWSPSTRPAACSGMLPTSLFTH
jgi:ApeA N-terminal domain 1